MNNNIKSESFKKEKGIIELCEETTAYLREQHQAPFLEWETRKRKAAFRQKAKNAIFLNYDTIGFDDFVFNGSNIMDKDHYGSNLIKLGAVFFQINHLNLSSLQIVITSLRDIMISRPQIPRKILAKGLEFYADYASLTEEDKAIAMEFIESFEVEQ